jgi:magnesium transporter
MLRIYMPAAGRLTEFAPGAGETLPAEATWIDLFQPTRAEEKLVEAALGVEVPTREEMQEIEPSSRLYEDNGALFMTASVVRNAETDEPESTPVTFILARGTLVTLRYAEPHSFRIFIAHAERQAGLCATGPSAFVNLLEAIIDREADILEHVAADVDSIAAELFRPGAPGQRGRVGQGGYQGVLARIGRSQNVTSKTRDSLGSLNRLLIFLSSAGERALPKDLRGRVKSMGRDVASLTDSAGFLAGNINFLLNASLGMIANEQNGIIKIFSVAAVVFLPPTLVASIYGMNFEVMPELHWLFGYPFALALMVVSAILPYWYFKHRGWL